PVRALDGGGESRLRTDSGEDARAGCCGIERLDEHSEDPSEADLLQDRHHEAGRTGGSASREPRRDGPTGQWRACTRRSWDPGDGPPDLLLRSRPQERTARDHVPLVRGIALPGSPRRYGAGENAEAIDRDRETRLWILRPGAGLLGTELRTGRRTRHGRAGY